MDRRSLLPALACLVLLAALALMWHGLAREREVATADRARVATALERIDANLAAQSGRLARLEAGSRRALPIAYAPAPVGTRTTGDRAPPAESREQALRVIEDRFIGEPLSPPWAQRHEQVVEGFLADANLARLQLPVPLRRDVACHSRLCRISLGFADADLAAPTHERMLMSISESLPSAQTFTLAQADGTVELVIFAGDIAGTSLRANEPTR